MDMKERVNRVTLDFSLKSHKYYAVEEALNFDCREGCLRSGIVFTKLTTDDGGTRTCPKEDIAALMQIPYYDGETRSYQERYGAIDGNGTVYFQKNDGAAYEAVATGLLHPAVEQYTAIDHVPWTIVLGGGGFILNADGEKTVFSRTDFRSAACFFKHRLFAATEHGGLLYSAPEDVEDFNDSLADGGTVFLSNEGGQIEALKVFKGYLCVFFSRGIARVEIKGDPKDFVVEKIDYAGGKIFSRMVCACGENILFMASDGLYRFDGKTAKRLFADFVKLPLTETKKEGSVALHDRAMFHYTTEEGEKTLVAYADGKDCYYADGLTALSGVDRETALFIYSDNSICRLAENGDTVLDGVFKFKTDFGLSGYKTLRSLRFEGEGSFELTVEADKRKLKRTVVFVDGVAEVLAAERGRNFTLTLRSKGKIAVRKLTAELNRIA